MRINEILTESTELSEGPLGNAVNAIGRGIGKTVGTVAKGVGAVAGGVVGVGKALAKGYNAGKAVVGDPDADTPSTKYNDAKDRVEPATPAQNSPSTSAPAAAPASSAPAAAPSAPAAGSQTLYAQVRSQVDKLDKKGKQRILQVLQKSLGQPAPSAAPTAAPAAKPATTKAPTGKPTPAKSPKTAPAASAVQTNSIDRLGKFVIAENISLFRKY